MFQPESKDTRLRIFISFGWAGDANVLGGAMNDRGKLDRIE
jgi:hypothetical protein